MRRTEVKHSEISKLFVERVESITEEIGVHNTHMNIKTCGTSLLVLVNDYPVMKLEIYLKPNFQKVADSQTEYKIKFDVTLVLID